MIKTNTISSGTQSERHSGLELLRIFSMLCIIAHHFSIHGNMDGSTSLFNRIVMDIFLFGGQYGVNIFIMISGYCLIKSSFTLRKFVKLIAETFFYSALIYALFAASGIIGFSWGALKAALLPSTFYEYWFVSSYLFVYILSPFLNKLLNILIQKEYLFLTVLLFGLYYIALSRNVPLPRGLWFMLLYILAAYFRRFPIRLQKNKFINLSVALGTLIISVTLKTVFDIDDFFKMTNILLAACSLFTFFLFSNFDFRSKGVNLVAATTLGIYLIHDNIYIRKVLWSDFFRTAEHLNAGYLIFYAIAVVIAVFAVCAVIDFARAYLLERPLFKLYDKLCLKIKNNRLKKAEKNTGCD